MGTPGRSLPRRGPLESHVVDGGCTAIMLGRRGSGDARGDGRRAGQQPPGAVPTLSAADPGRAARPGPRRPSPDRCDPRGPAGARVPVLRAARHRQDLHRADPGQDGQLRERAHRRAVRRLRAVRRDPRRDARRRRRDRRRVARRGRRRARAPREGAHRADGRAREGLHHRRGAAAVARGVRRTAEAVRGAAARRPVRAGDHRAAQDAGDDRRPVPAVRFPAPHDRRTSPRIS